MFNSKQEKLFDVKEKQTTSVKNAFINAAMEDSITTTSGNGAKKYTTTLNDFVDQFGYISNYRKPRSFEDISKDMFLLWSQDPKLTLKLTLYIRMISRKVQLFNGLKTEKTQIGQGLKHEGIVRMLWIAMNDNETFWNNIALFVSVGSWKDVIQMLSYDLQYHGWDNRKLDWNGFGQLILAGLENPNTVNLVKKYLPSIRTRNKCKTLESQADNLIGKWISNLLFKNDSKSYEKYRKLKSTGTAHEWQQLISKGKMLDIDFSKVHGRALSLMVSGKFIQNNGLTKKFDEWVDKQPVIKYTGYVYELLKPLQHNKFTPISKKMIDKQFMMLVDQVKEQTNVNTRFIPVLDTSGSMGSNAIGTDVTSIHVAKSIGIFFSEMLEGHFKNHWIEFNSDAKMKQWTGTTPTDKYINHYGGYNGDTNFVAVASLFGEIKNQGVSEDEFPTGIICISDGEFNGDNKSTNLQNFKRILKDNGFSNQFVENFKIVLWDIPNGFYGRDIRPKFETKADTPNMFYMSGFDPSALSFLLGSVDTKEDKVETPTTAEELFHAAMDQEVLNLIK